MYFILFVVAFGFSALAQKRMITLEDIYLKNTFILKNGQHFRWTKNGQYFTNLENNKIVRYSVLTGEKIDELFNQPINWLIQDYELSADEKKILLFTNQEYIYRRSFSADYYIYDIATRNLQPLSLHGKQMHAQFSPDGTKVAFCRDNNLFIKDLITELETAVTTSGKPSHIINGMADWVYEEEFGFSRAFFWSPDSKRLAFYTFDESHVKEYNMTLWNAPALYPQDYRFKYPKAGESNAFVQINVYDLNNTQSISIDIGKETDIYIPRVVWTQNPHILSVTRLNRLQNKLEILHTNLTTHQTNVVLTEESDTYIDINHCPDLIYLQDGIHFITTSEMSGYKHLYLFNTEGKPIKQLTSGNWEVTEVLGIDQRSKKPVLYFLSTEVSPLEQHLYSLTLDGKTKKRITTMEGVHEANFSPDFEYYVLRSSNIKTPLQVALYRTQTGERIKVLENNHEFSEKAQTFDFAPKELFSFTTSDGTTLYGWILKPQNFDSTKQYPLLMHVYGGPGSQMVRNEYGGRHFLWHQYLVQQGFIVACIDNRGTDHRGTKFKKSTYGILGKYELQDQTEGARFLIAKGFVNPEKVGIWGWSYGGYMALLCLLKEADIFKFAIAVAPVTSWRFYDTIYTERFLRKPQDNPQGYDDYSPLSHAHLLRGKLLLIHGTGDDNVHFQNTVALQHALIQAGKQFQSFFYPDSNHGITGKQTRYHLYSQMSRFLAEN